MASAEQIRTVATRLFARQGFRGTSLQDIATEIGVTKQTLLYHYPNKEALRRAVLDQVLAHWRERLPQMLQAFTSGRRRFDALTSELVAFFESDLDRARLIARELLDSPEEMQRILLDNLRPWVMLVAEYIRDGQRLGMIHEDVDAEAYVMHVIVLVIAAIAHRSALIGALGPPGAPADELARRFTAELYRLTRQALFKRAREAGVSAEAREVMP